MSFITSARPRVTSPRAVALAMLLALLAAIAPVPARAAFPGNNGPMFYERDGDIIRRSIDGTVRNLTANLGAHVYNPAVSKDGMWVAFDNGYDMYVARRDGTNRTYLDTDLDRCNSATDPQWSPNGARLAFICNTPGAPYAMYEIFTMRRDGTGYRRISQNAEADSVAWSPDGTKLAWTDGDVIYMAPASGDGVVKVVHDDPPSSENDPTSGGWVHVDWAPDGSHLIAENLTVGLYTVPKGEHVEGQEELVLLDGTASEPAYSPSGTRVLFTDNTAADPDNDLFTVKLDGSGRQRVTNSAGDEASPEWARRT